MLQQPFIKLQQENAKLDQLFSKQAQQLVERKMTPAQYQQALGDLVIVI